jgi:hypothetical protein
MTQDTSNEIIWREGITPEEIRYLKIRIDTLESAIEAIKNKVKDGYVIGLAFVGDTPIFFKERPK